MKRKREREYPSIFPFSYFCFYIPRPGPPPGSSPPYYSCAFKRPRMAEKMLNGFIDRGPWILLASSAAWMNEIKQERRTHREREREREGRVDDNAVENAVNRRAVIQAHATLVCFAPCAATGTFVRPLRFRITNNRAEAGLALVTLLRNAKADVARRFVFKEFG